MQEDVFMRNLSPQTFGKNVVECTAATIPADVHTSSFGPQTRA
jgi:hypothetical protein